uniref:Amine oxidase n=1 Tax=Lepisosteus oculatus TaxID=7918 RepID=W5MFW5_LEPOC
PPALCVLVSAGLLAACAALTGALQHNAGDPLAKCLQDSDYEELLDIVHRGLPRARTPRHIAIVGAGMAGLTAAKLLEDAGHKELKMDRVDVKIELYFIIHELYFICRACRILVSGRILLAIIEKLGVPVNKFFQDDINTYYYVNGVKSKTYTVENNPDVLRYPVSARERGRSAAQLFDMALWKIRDDLKKSHYDCKKIMKKYDAYSVKEYLEREGNLSQGALQMIGDILNVESFFYTALTETLMIQADINDNSTYSEITGGFDHLPNAFYRVLNCTILLQSKVTRVRQNRRGVTVFFEDRRNPAVRTNITADYVLMTATAKATLFVDFQPPLSAPKMAALRQVHYSGSTKVILGFSKRFWEDDHIRGGKTITDLPSRFIYYPSHGFNGTSGGAILASYTCSDEAARFEGMSEEDLLAMALGDLAEIHGDFIRPLCTGGKVKKWASDPYSLGAFAIFTPYQQTDFASLLFQSERRVHFAGEHTATPHAWIETAMKSALRAARNINSQQ